MTNQTINFLNSLKPGSEFRLFSPNINEKSLVTLINFLFDKDYLEINEIKFDKELVKMLEETNKNGVFKINEIELLDTSYDPYLTNYKNVEILVSIRDERLEAKLHNLSMYY